MNREQFDKGFEIRSYSDECLFAEPPKQIKVEYITVEPKGNRPNPFLYMMYYLVTVTVMNALIAGALK